MQGLRLLPWVQHERDERQKQKQPYWRDYLDCNRCLKADYMSKDVRRTYNCGYLKKADWTGPGYPLPFFFPELIERVEGETDYEYRLRAKDQVCPGYLISLPQVIEACQSHFHYSKAGDGGLRLNYEGRPITKTLMTCIEILEGANSEVQAYMMRPKDS